MHFWAFRGGSGGLGEEIRESGDSAQWVGLTCVWGGDGRENGMGRLAGKQDSKRTSGPELGLNSQPASLGSKGVRNLDSPSSIPHSTVPWNEHIGLLLSSQQACMYVTSPCLLYPTSSHKSPHLFAASLSSSKEGKMLVFLKSEIRDLNSNKLFEAMLRRILSVVMVRKKINQTWISASEQETNLPSGQAEEPHAGINALLLLNILKFLIIF